ncbi:fibronectin type III domain-containing protein [Bacteriovoracales bacterium]|nr:fibronectin type III domain-containing protein [Bacteriovoracales bacterium]
MKVLLCLTMCVLSVQVFAKGYFPDELKHFRLVWHEDPAHEATLAWHTKGSAYNRKSSCYVDTVSRRGRLKAYKKFQKTNFEGSLSSDSKLDTGLNYFVHACKLENLKPSTKYYFVIKSGQHVSKELYFITAPDDGRSFKLIFGGDSRDNIPSIKQPRRPGINRFMSKMIEKDPSILALVHGGDYVFFGKIFRDFRKWFKDHLLTITKNGRFLPVIPSRGNHEKNLPLFNDLFIMHGPRLKNSYYVTKINNLHIFNLNTNISMGGDQRKWLRTNLKKYAVNGNWVFPNYHEPAWPAVKKPSGALKHFVPLFDEFQVDLVFESDGHTLKKTVPIYGGKKDMKKGIIYLGEGGLGVGQRNPKNKSSWFLKKPGFTMPADHLFLTEMTKENAKISIISPQCKYFLIKGWSCSKAKTIDSFVLKHRKR